MNQKKAPPKPQYVNKLEQQVERVIEKKKEIVKEVGSLKRQVDSCEREVRVQKTSNSKIMIEKKELEDKLAKATEYTRKLENKLAALARGSKDEAAEFFVHKRDEMLQAA